MTVYLKSELRQTQGPSVYLKNQFLVCCGGGNGEGGEESDYRLNRILCSECRCSRCRLRREVFVRIQLRFVR